MKYAVIDRMGDEQGHSLIKEIHNDLKTAVNAAERLSKEAYAEGWTPTEIDFGVMEFQYVAAVTVLEEPKTSITWATGKEPKAPQVPKKREELSDWICRKPGDVFCEIARSGRYEDKRCATCDYSVRR